MGAAAAASGGLARRARERERWRVAAALRAAPKLPRDGAWGVGQRKRTDPAPSPLPKDFPLPLVQPASDHNNWYFADIADVLQLDNPANLYGILQDTGTQKVLFELPTVPQFSLFSPPGSIPGIKLPNPPNFADVASLLNATGLFPDISSTPETKREMVISGGSETRSAHSLNILAPYPARSMRRTGTPGFVPPTSNSCLKMLATLRTLPSPMTVTPYPGAAP